MNKKYVTLGEVLIVFSSFDNWVDKAQSRFSILQGYKKYLCLDKAGRVCMTGEEFMRARDDNSFPVTVYSIEV